MLTKFKKKLEKIERSNKPKPSSAHSGAGTDTFSLAAAFTIASILPAGPVPQPPSAPLSGSTSSPNLTQEAPVDRPDPHPPTVGNALPFTIHNDATGGNRDPQPPSISLPPGSNTPCWINNVLTASLKTLKSLIIPTGAPTVGYFIEGLEYRLEKSMESLKAKQELVGTDLFDRLTNSTESLEEKVAEVEHFKEYLELLMELIASLAEGRSSTSQTLRDSLRGLYSSLSGTSKKLYKGEDDEVFLEGVAREIVQTLDSFMFVNCISGIIKLTDTHINIEKHVLGQRVQNLPRVDAAYNDYKSKSGGCSEGTRESLLNEIAKWALENLRIYFLSGIAGIGKSTIAFTVAERAELLGCLGASFFFSRDEADRSNAKRFFTTIAYQLCHYHKEFSLAIEHALLTERGSAATAKDPITQLEALILEPLRDIVKSRSSPIVMVVDALDECDDGDAPVVLAALSRLVQELPCFKVIVTTRPQPHLAPILSAHQVFYLEGFYLQDIEDRIVGDDIQRYLKYELSWKQVKASLPALEEKWSANDDEIEYLVRATGRLLIMASTAVRFILDSTSYDPRSQLEALKADGLENLGNFYNLILWRAVPNKPAMADRFKVIIGTILVVQEPLPVKTLRHLAHPWSVDVIKGDLTKLQSVVVLKDDTPRIYHRSFFDFLTDAHHCAKDLQIDMKAHHTRVAIRCFQIMNKTLKENILDLGTPARFMDNDNGLAAENITAEKLREKIPGELRYVCIYWANHLESADTRDASLAKEVTTFMKEHLLHWLEVLSLIRRLATAYPALLTISGHMKSISSDLLGIITDTLYFILRFSEQIHRSALHIYYSALPFTPTDRPLYKSYSAEMIHNLCRLEGTAAQWDALITYFSQGPQEQCQDLVFSHDGLKFASSSDDGQETRLWDAENGMLLQTHDGDRLAIAGDFSTVAAVSKDHTVTVWDLASNAPVVTVTLPDQVIELALSFDGSQLAASYSNGIVDLWDMKSAQVIVSITGGSYHDLRFAPRGHTFAYISNGTIRLLDEPDGNLDAGLYYELGMHVKFVFSRDGHRLVSLATEDDGYSLTMWDTESGALIDVARNVGDIPVTLGVPLAISEDGSFIATGGWKTAQLWSGSPLSLVHTLDIGGWIDHLAISCDILAIGSADVGALMLYDVNNHAVITTLHGVFPRGLALSPDCSRLAVGNLGGGILFDAVLLKSSVSASTQQHKGVVWALVFSPDTSRLASGFQDGTIELWDTNHTVRPIATHKVHSQEVAALAFSSNNEQFASVSEDQTIRFWDGTDGTPISKLEHSFTGTLTSIAFSRDFLAIATASNITLFDNESLCVVDTLENGAVSLSFSADGSLLASASRDDRTRGITVWNVAEHAAVVTFPVNSGIYGLRLSPDGSQLAAQSWGDGSFEFFDIVNKHSFELTGHEDLSWVPNLMNDVLISWKYDHVHGDCLVGQFSGRHDWVPVLWIPKGITVASFEVGSSIVALGCSDGRILFVRFPTTSVS